MAEFSDFIVYADESGDHGMVNIDPQYRRHDFTRFDFQPVFIPKAANASGLQLADLTARPIALSRLRPDQPNRAFDIIQPKLGGLKCFPQVIVVQGKTKGPRKLQNPSVDREMPNPLTDI